MAESKERRKAPRKAIQATPRPDTGLATSSEDTRRRIAEAAYFRAKERNFEPGHELEGAATPGDGLGRGLAREPACLRRQLRPHPLQSDRVR